MITVDADFQQVNADLVKKPIHIITITGYDKVFTNVLTGVSGQKDWIVGIDDFDISVNDLDGSTDQGTFGFTVQDGEGARELTADMPGFVFEGKKVVVKTGFHGLAQSKFATIFTGIIDRVENTNDNLEYYFLCADPRVELNKTIYTLGDDGLTPVSKDNPRTLLGNPLDILINALETECGIAAGDIDLAKIEAYRDSIFAGKLFLFKLSEAVEARDFIINEIMKPLGGYIRTNNLGQITVNFFYPLGEGVSVSLSGNARPWVTGQGLYHATSFNSSYLFGGSGDSKQYNFPIVLPVTPGKAVTMTYLHGTVSRGGVFIFTDPTGDPAPAHGTPGSGWPGFYTSHNVAGSPVAAWCDQTGQILATPFYPGLGGTFTPPAGAALLQLGINDFNNWSDNSGAYVYSVTGLAVPTGLVFNPDNLLEIPAAAQADLVDQMQWSFDHVDDSDSTNSSVTNADFLSGTVQQYGAAVAKYGVYGSKQIESKGMRAGLQGFSLARLVSRLIFLRYGNKNLILDSSGSGSGGNGLVATWDMCIAEPGDVAYVSHPAVPDRDLGVVGINAKVFECLDVSLNFNDGRVTIKALAVDLTVFQQYLITPDAQASYTGSSSTDKGKYMFLCNDSDLYSNGDPAHTLG